MNADSQEATLDLRGLLTFLARGALLAVLLAGVAGVATYLLAERQPASFRADAALLLADGTSPTTQFGATSIRPPPIGLASYEAAATSDRVLSDALERLGVTEPSVLEIRRLRTRVSASADANARDASLLQVAARGSSASVAIERANAVASSLVAWDRSRATESGERLVEALAQQTEGLSEQIRSLQAIDGETDQEQIDGLIRLRAEQQQQLAYARALVASPEGMLSVLQESDSTVRQIAPRPVVSAFIASVVAVMAAYLFLLARIALDTRLRSLDDVADVTGLPVLATFPAAGRTKQERLREASSYLRSNLLFATDDVQPKIFMITSSVAREGKTMVSRHLAESFVRYGYRTLFVDCDLRSPTVGRLYMTGNTVSTPSTTVQWLADPTAAHRIMRVDVAGDQYLDVIPQLDAVPDAAEVLGRGFRHALEVWKKYDVVVIDTAPVLAVADALAVAPHCTGAVYVVDRGRTDRRKLTAGIGALQRIGVQVFGVVANNDGPAGGMSAHGATYGSPYGPAPVPRGMPSSTELRGTRD